MEVKSLKPCPFCGGKAVFWQTDYGKGDRSSVGLHFTIRCNKCGSTRGTAYGNVFFNLSKTGELNILSDDREKVIEEWNMRA
jgi:Lar family restriction alleviation protein